MARGRRSVGDDASSRDEMSVACMKRNDVLQLLAWQQQQGGPEDDGGYAAEGASWWKGSVREESVPFGGGKRLWRSTFRIWEKYLLASNSQQSVNRRKLVDVMMMANCAHEMVMMWGIRWKFTFTRIILGWWYFFFLFVLSCLVANARSGKNISPELESRLKIICWLRQWSFSQ